LVDDFSLSLKKKRFSPSNYRDIDGYRYDGYDGWLMISFCGVFRGTTWYYPSKKTSMNWEYLFNYITDTTHLLLGMNRIHELRNLFNCLERWLKRGSNFEEKCWYNGR